MRAVDIIRKKRDSHPLTANEIDAFIHAVVGRAWPEYQISALLMAIVLRGMTAEETAALTAAMVRSGVRLDLSDIPGAKVDKHSTGGVGDKTSLIIAPLVAACGLIVPMMSGRGLGHTGGTLDKLEAIPGFRVGLSLEEAKAGLRKVGCVLIGQTKEIAPADKILYALRDVTATVESIPLITASILSKKIAEGIDALIMDVKCGKGAFMKSREDARALAESIVAIGNANGVRTEALVTAMDQPLGFAAGHSLEVIEAIETLKGRGPADLESLSVTLAARMVRLGGTAATDEEAERIIRAALTSGRGVEKLRAIIINQGGDARVIDDYRLLPTVPHRDIITAEQTGYVVGLHAELIGRAILALGAGRNRVEDEINHAVGAVVKAKIGTLVQAGDPVIELHHPGEHLRAAAAKLAAQAVEISSQPPPPQALIWETVT